ncbi:hypothetical protein S83_062892 [Arachis hypogaea]
MLHSSYLFVQLILRLIGWGEYFSVGSHCRYWFSHWKSLHWLLLLLLLLKACVTFPLQVLSGIALLSFRLAKAPRDKQHPYGKIVVITFLYHSISGHRKFETLGALGISCMLLGTAGGIACHAVDILMELFSSGPEMVSHAVAHEHVHSHGHGGHHHGIDMEHPILALNMTILSICIKEGLYWITKRAGEKQGSGLMKANAWHHRADAISSVVALIGVDPLTGLLVAGMILKAGAETGYQSILELVDATIPASIWILLNQEYCKLMASRGVIA